MSEIMFYFIKSFDSKNLFFSHLKLKQFFLLIECFVNFIHNRIAFHSKFYCFFCATITTHFDLNHIFREFY